MHASRGEGETDARTHTQEATGDSGHRKRADEAAIGSKGAGECIKGALFVVYLPMKIFFKVSRLPCDDFFQHLQDPGTRNQS